MSIHPEFADRILSGNKTVEFRKRGLADDVDAVVVYATHPVSAVVGWFSVGTQHRVKPRDLWKMFGASGGISRSRFFKYYEDCPLGVGIEVGRAERFSEPMRITEIAGVSRPPQSFQYLSELQIARLPQLADRSNQRL